ncbi:non-ribosomal peptide synthetase component F [Bradyrhizobium niftali]|uniref:hypothetical protein n=1 Tax=Bradyrhizobium niftali TaxID=2560055 RepID=UPI00383959D8
MGLFINTLPLRLDLDRTAVEASLHITHARLPELLAHEHASLALGVFSQVRIRFLARRRGPQRLPPNVVRRGKWGR